MLSSQPPHSTWMLMEKITPRGVSTTLSEPLLGSRHHSTNAITSFAFFLLASVCPDAEGEDELEHPDQPAVAAERPGPADLDRAAEVRPRELRGGAAGVLDLHTAAHFHYI